MIIDGFLYIVYAFVYAITSPLRLFSDVSIASGFTSAIATAGQYLSSVQEYLPLDIIFLVLGVRIAAEIAYMTYKGIMWLIRRIPTQS